MPVGHGSVDESVPGAHAEPLLNPQPSVKSPAQAVPHAEDLEAPTHDPGRAIAQAAPSSQTGPQTAHGTRALVQYDYEKAEDNEIELNEGEYVTNIDMIDEDWWMGVNARGESGLFPRNYVELIASDEAEDSPAPIHQVLHEPEREISAASEPLRSDGPTATALYDYEAAEDNEIGFPEGAKITNIVSLHTSLAVNLPSPAALPIYSLTSKGLSLSLHIRTNERFHFRYLEI